MVMRHVELIPIALVTFALVTISETTIDAQVKNFRPYETWVTKLNGQPDVYGILHDVNDSLIVLSNSVKINDYEPSGYNSITIGEIDEIKLRRKGKFWRSALIGLGVGAVIGGVIGNLSSKNGGGCWGCPADYTAYGAMGLGLVGGVVGTFVGLARINIPINGQKSNFKANEDRLYKYSYKWGPIAP